MLRRAGLQDRLARARRRLRGRQLSASDVSVVGAGRRHQRHRSGTGECGASRCAHRGG